MSCYVGPDVVENGLVFYYDQNNIQKSWKGKPTTNLVPDIPSWGTSAVVSLLSELSPINTPVYSITDNNSGSWLNLARNTTVPNDSNTYTISIYIKKTYGSTSARLGFNTEFSGGTTPLGYNQRFNSDTGVGTSGSTISLGNWWRWQFQLTNNTTGNTSLNCSFYPATGLYDAGDNSAATGTAIVSAIQIEQNSFATPFVNGTRSNTQAILDLTGNNTITANSLTYASDGSFSFDGDNQIITTSFNQYLPNMTWSAWIYPISNASSINMFMGYNLPYFGFKDGNSLMFSNYISGTQITIYTTTNLTLNTWYYATFSTYFDGTSTIMKTYTNGIESASGSFLGQQTNTGYNFSIGDGHSTVWYRFNGKIPIVQIYNRCLSAAEVSQNFNATRRKC